MPDVIGLPVSDAREAVARAGFCAVQVLPENSNTVAPGVVLASDPRPGTRAVANWTVQLRVSTGKDGPTTPTTSPPPTVTTLPATTPTTPPANQPATIEIVSIENTGPMPGQPVIITVHATDPDARILDSCFGDVSWGDTDDHCAVSCGPATSAPEAGELTKQFTHEYDAGGSYTVTITVKSGLCSPAYASEATATTTINVRTVLHTVPPSSP
jgi:hypothetical protein